MAHKHKGGRVPSHKLQNMIRYNKGGNLAMDPITKEAKKGQFFSLRFSTSEWQSSLIVWRVSSANPSNFRVINIKIQGGLRENLSNSDSENFSNFDTPEGMFNYYASA